MTKYYKFLTVDDTGEYSGFDFTEYLPKGGKPGKWMPLIENLVKCEAGYHFCDKKNIAEWCNAQLFEIEYKGEIVEAGQIYIAQQIRFVKKITKWNDKNARLAACDIAEQIAMKVWNKYYPEDLRPQNAIDTARRFANGKASKEELDAARTEAWDAARDVAGTVALEADCDTAWEAVRAAARTAAWDVARTVALDAARTVALEADWDTANKIICKYAGI